MKKFRIKYKAMAIEDGQLFAKDKINAKKRFIAAYKAAHGKGSHIKIISIVEDK